MSNLYRVSTSPTHDVLTLAEKRGMKLGDGTSVWDWIEDAECEKFSPTTSRFSAACAVARSDAKRDICGEARIQEVVWVKWRDAPASWEVVATWLLYEETDDPSEGEPDYRDELSLEAGDVVST